MGDASNENAPIPHTNDAVASIDACKYKSTVSVCVKYALDLFYDALALHDCLQFVTSECKVGSEQLSGALIRVKSNR